MNEDRKILIIDDDIMGAELLEDFLVTYHYQVNRITKVYNHVVQAIRYHLPDIIILSIYKPEDDTEGLKIAQYIHDEYYIPVLLMIVYNGFENLEGFVNTFPFIPLMKTNDNNYKQILFSLQFTEPYRVYKLCKFKSIFWKVMQLGIDGKSEPVLDRNKEHHYLYKKISLSDILYFRAGNAYVKNSILIKLKSDEKHFYSFKNTLVNILRSVPEKFFVQIHDAYIISIDKITGHNLLLEIEIDGIFLPIGGSFTDEARIAINDHLKLVL